MSKPFDATTKELLEKAPRAWLEFLLGRDVDQVRVVNADLSTITSEVDKVFRVGDKEPWMVHVELLSSRRPDLPLRVQRYNILVRCRHKRPVQSVVVLLRREADGPNLSGLLQDHLPSGSLYHEFRYNVVRVWERSVEEILAGDIAILPVAPIASVSSTKLPDLIRRMDDLLNREATPAAKADVWAATYILMGLVYPENAARALLQGVWKMKESTTYQAILREGKAEGKAEEAKAILLRLGRKRFGPPKAATKKKIDAITDFDRLELLVDRVFDAKSWDDVMAAP